jgi:hypothetical protein
MVSVAEAPPETEQPTPDTVGSVGSVGVVDGVVTSGAAVSSAGAAVSSAIRGGGSFGK